MGLRNIGKKLRADTGELSANRLVNRFEGLGHAKIGSITARERVTICGEIKRMSIKPRSGIPAVELVLNDGTGNATVIFSGRRQIPGIHHGQCIEVTGVAFADHGINVFLNPAYRILPTAGD